MYPKKRHKCIFLKRRTILFDRHLVVLPEISHRLVFVFKTGDEKQSFLAIIVLAFTKVRGKQFFYTQKKGKVFKKDGLTAL